MSMLAERRQKQRWSLNPRGKLWLEDKNAFGQKMLEKMGWKHGKGLGANEDGCTESLQVTYKNDNKGMGYKEIEGWTAHEDNFSSLLKNLNQNTGEESEDTKITSLEKKVQNSRARINYHKFTKAKDLSRYSEKDLANIFGKKSLKQIPNNEASTHEEKPIENSKIGNRNDLLVNKGSMLDYFKKKLPNFGKNHSEKGTIDESDCENMKIGFGFSQNHNKNYEKRKRSYTDAISSTEGSSDEPSKKKKAKTSKMNGTFVSYVYQDDCQVNRADEIEEKSSLEGEGRKKKKSKQRNKEDTINVEENQNPIPEDSKKKKSKSNIEENIDFEEFHGNNQTNSVSIEAISKSKKKKQKNETGIDQIICDESIQNDEQTKIDKKQKKSKKNHEESINLGISNAAFCDFNNSELEEVENQVLVEENCNQPKKSKKKSKEDRVNEEIAPNIVEVCRTEKKKSKKNKQNQVAHETNEYQFEICESEQATKKQKKSKKLKTTENDNCGISNPVFCDNINSSNNCISQEEFDQNQEISDNDTPKRKKKKKRKSKNIENGIDNPTFNPTSDSPDTTQESEDVFQKNPEERKKSSEELNLGLDNPTLNLNDIILDSDLMLNVVSTPVILKKPSIEKVALNSRIERIKNVRRKSVRFNDVLEEHIIPNDPSERVNEYISQRNELFDINTMIIEEGIKEEMEKNGMKYERGPQISYIEDPEELNQLVVESSVKEELNRGLNPQAGFVNNAFDIRSVDKIDFYNDKYEIKTSPNINGIDNRGFNKLKTQIDENIEDISNTIDRYQAEVENDINESKDTQSNHQPPEEWLVGDVGSQINQNTRVKRVTKLCFKEMHFKTPIPHYLKSQNISRAKKSYRHLIRGDITLAFKDANLHEIKGYAAQNGERQVLR